jgi:hypothetical protein
MTGPAPKADFDLRSCDVADVPVPDSMKRMPNAGLSAVRKRFHQFADRLDEHLRDWAERPILQGRDADRLSNVGQFDRQCFKSGMFTRQEEREADDHSEETLRREQLVAQ